MKKPELIAPAGNFRKMKYALEYGADAVYLGIPDFSLRVRINQFDIKSLKEGVEYAHNKKKKVYVTINIYAHNEHINKLPAYVKKLKEYKVDGLIISDPGVIAVVKQIWPEAKIHLSTQANTTNWQAAKFWYQQGVKRIVLARECTLEEVKEIHRRVPKLELEYFVHGAMCMSYSGRCILSKYFTGKSANLGDCTQPCRWQFNVKTKKVKPDLESTEYYLEEVKRAGDLLPFEEDMHGTYILNSKDMCMIKYLDELADAGVSSFKIEGRAKSIYYVAVVVGSYRKVIDQLKVKSLKAKKLKENLFNELKKLANRGFTTGFLFGKDKFENSPDNSHSESEWEFVGEVVETVEVEKKNVWLTVIPHNSLLVGDKIEALQPDGEIVRLVIKKMIDEKNKAEITEAHGGNEMVVRVLVGKELMGMSLLRKKIKSTVK